MVESQSDALVAKVGKDGEGVSQGVVGEAVGVVAEAHVSDFRNFPNYRNRVTRSIWRVAAGGKPSKCAEVYRHAAAFVGIVGGGGQVARPVSELKTPLP